MDADEALTELRIRMDDITGKSLARDYQILFRVDSLDEATLDLIEHGWREEIIAAVIRHWDDDHK